MRVRPAATLALTRAGFTLFEAVAPGLGARYALRLWCTPPRPRSRSTVPERPAGGERFVVPVDGGEVVAESWGSGSTVYLVHGWGGRRQHLDPFVTPLVDSGHRVVSFDLPSHGESAPGRYGRGRSGLPEFVAVLASVVEAVGPADGIVGHSLGGSATALAVLGGVPARRVVLVSAPADPIASTRTFASALGFGERIRSRLLRRMERLVRQPVADFDIPLQVRRLREVAQEQGQGPVSLPRALVIHDRDDKEIPHTDAGAIRAAWPGAEELRTHGLGHRRILRDPEVTRRVADFLARVG